MSFSSSEMEFICKVLNHLQLTVYFLQRCDAEFYEILKKTDLILDFQISKSEIMQAKRLQCFFLWGSGKDKVDFVTLRQKNIKFIFQDNLYGAHSIFEYVLMSILISERELIKWNDISQRGGWSWEQRQEFHYRELSQITIGIWGLGVIGKCVFERFSAIGVDVIGISNHTNTRHNIYKQDQILEVIQDLDYLSLHMALNENTKEIVSCQYFSFMKKGAVLINTARGELISEKDLAFALKNRLIRKAIIDTTVVEPMDKTSPLYNCPNLVVTPHYSGKSSKARTNMLHDVIKSIESYLLRK